MAGFSLFSSLIPNPSFYYDILSAVVIWRWRFKDAARRTHTHTHTAGDSLSISDRKAAVVERHSSSFKRKKKIK